MTNTLIGYARCSTDRQDLAAQKDALQKFGVATGRIYTDHGFTGANRARPGLDQALAAVRRKSFGACMTLATIRSATLLKYFQSHGRPSIEL